MFLAVELSLQSEGLHDRLISMVFLVTEFLMLLIDINSPEGLGLDLLLPDFVMWEFVSAVFHHAEDFPGSTSFSGTFPSSKLSLPAKSSPSKPPCLARSSRSRDLSRGIDPSTRLSASKGPGYGLEYLKFIPLKSRKNPRRIFELQC